MATARRIPAGGIPGLLLACGLALAGTAFAGEPGHYADPAALADAVQRIDSGRYQVRTEVPDGPVLREGDEGEAVATVIGRLQEGGYLGQDFAGETYDARVADAVRAFQQSHGLKVDGLLGPNTRAAMNASPRDRLPELRANLKEQDAFFSNAPQRYVLVNIPDARLVYFEDGKPYLEMAVIVGQEGWDTPTMDEEIEHLVVNPDWDVPASIVAEEIAPRVRENSAYLEENRMVIYESWEPGAPTVDPATIDWGSVTEAGWDYRLQQRPGPKNPLGQVKIAFPNDESIYLHDTPHDQLFEKNQRGLSHGCIRMEKPLELAGRLLELGTDDWDTARLRKAVETEEQQRVALDEPVPIHLVYWTAFVGSNGELQLRPDVYDRMDGEDKAGP